MENKEQVIMPKSDWMAILNLVRAITDTSDELVSGDVPKRLDDAVVSLFPTISVGKMGKATTITITDKYGAKTAVIYDGKNADEFTPEQLEALKGKDGKDASANFAICVTDGATAEKVVSVEGFELKVGAMVTVKFNYTNTVVSPTLNVSGTGAYPLIYKGNSITAYPLFTARSLEASRLYDFVFTGRNYELVGGLHVDSFADTSKNRNGYVKPTSNGDIIWTSGVGTLSTNAINKIISALPVYNGEVITI